MLLKTLYFASLTVIVSAAAAAVLEAARHRQDVIGPFGSAALGIVAVYALLGYEYTPRHWITGVLVGLALFIINVAWRWRKHVREAREAALRGGRRRTDPPTHVV